MQLTRWDPFPMTRWKPFDSLWREMGREMRRMRREMDRLFRSFGFDDFGWPELAVAYPPVNLWEDDNCLYAECELPGLELSDLEIYVTADNQLTIRGERKQPTFKEGRWDRQERGFGRFSRVIDLPAEVDADKIEAKLHHGVLTITMPKRESARPKKITVKAE
ncbi:MAG TPA: Hsp20/alpha crystallin family protein [Gemmataceae bacterium]|jgi:HSP20 family protein|nr:Hsp20/alpha crystallin family protein [Gemmataceae bacterium]